MPLWLLLMTVCHIRRQMRDDGEKNCNNIPILCVGFQRLQLSFYILYGQIKYLLMLKSPYNFGNAMPFVLFTHYDVTFKLRKCFADQIAMRSKVLGQRLWSSGFKSRCNGIVLLSCFPLNDMKIGISYSLFKLYSEFWNLTVGTNRKTTTSTCSLLKMRARQIECIERTCSGTLCI